MPKTEPQSSEEMERIHIWLYRSDVEKLRMMFDRTLGFSRAVRVIIRKALKEIEAKASTKSRPVPLTEVDLEARSQT